MVVTVGSAVVGSCAGRLFKFELAVFGTADDLAACLWSPFKSFSQCSRCETSLEGISLAELQVLAFREAHCSSKSDGCFK